jgi:hypothetical protein
MQHTIGYSLVYTTATDDDAASGRSVIAPIPGRTCINILLNVSCIFRSQYIQISFYYLMFHVYSDLILLFNVSCIQITIGLSLFFSIMFA